VYLSLNHPVVFLTPLGGTGGGASTAELARLYDWVMQHRAVYAYPSVNTQHIQPARNESHVDDAVIGDWCDTQDGAPRAAGPPHRSMPSPASTGRSTPLRAARGVLGNHRQRSVKRLRDDNEHGHRRALPG
jgi:hypothetical protein